MELKINIVEAAAELAERDVNSHFRKNLLDPYDEVKLERAVYIDNEDGSTSYRPEAQELFEIFYDEYFDVLLKCKCKEDDKNTD